uniref:LD03248p n=1 Tax=Drosophila melanogaster TaxID=7227 RepID=Q6NP64_DROME|nr:LD03248p [Drosophila melanogaster]
MPPDPRMAQTNFMQSGPPSIHLYVCVCVCVCVYETGRSVVASFGARVFSKNFLSVPKSLAVFSSWFQKFYGSTSAEAATTGLKKNI